MTTGITEAKITVLPPMKEEFCQLWNRCHNASLSAAKAGYSVETARAIGYNLLQEPGVKQRLKELDEADGPDPMIASAQERRRILTEIARAAIPDYQTKDGIKLDSDSPNLRAIRSVEVNASGRIKKIKLADPIAAIQEHNKMDGIGRDTGPALADNRVLIINVTDPNAKMMLSQVKECLMPLDTGNEDKPPSTPIPEASLPVVVDGISPNNDMGKKEDEV